MFKLVPATRWILRRSVQLSRGRYLNSGFDRAAENSAEKGEHFDQEPSFDDELDEQTRDNFHQTRRSDGGRSTLGLRNLKLESVVSLRTNRARFFDQNRDGYIQRIKDYQVSGRVDRIFTEDLINLIGLATTDEELDILESVAKLFPKSSWGAQVMRLYWNLGKSDRAYKMIVDKDLAEFFSGIEANKIAMALLCRDKMYHEALQVYKSAATKLQVPRYFSVLAIGACAKLGTREALREAKEIHATLKVDLKPGGRYGNSQQKADMYLAYLAFKCEEFRLALDTVSMSVNSNYAPMREILAQSLFKVQRYEDVLHRIKYTRNTTVRNTQYHCIMQDTYDLIMSNKEQIDDKEIQSSLVGLLEELKSEDLVSPKGLSEYIESSIAY